MVYAQQGAIGNMPMAAAFTLVPIVLIAVYLSIVKRLCEMLDATLERHSVPGQGTNFRVLFPRAYAS